MKIVIFRLVIVLISLQINQAYALENSRIISAMKDDALNLITDSERLNRFCDENFNNIPKDSCRPLLDAAIKSMAGKNIDIDDLKNKVKEGLLESTYLNSLLTKAYKGNVPLSLEFASFDSKENGENVLGLTYSFDYDFYESDIESYKAWNVQKAIAFKASGTVVNDSDKNPRNFLESKFSGSYSFTTSIPNQDPAFGKILVNLAIDGAKYCDYEGDSVTAECLKAEAAFSDAINQTSKFLTAFQRYEIGFDAGYETDQSFKAKQSAFGLFAFGQYEDWGTNSWAGGLNITPAFYMALDKIDPNDKTPRAIAGDDSSYYRVNGELSLWMPIGNYLKKNVVFTVSYRIYQELSASEVVKSGNLDSSELSTFSLTSANGLFVTYSTGKLPFEIKNDDVVELGWKTYF